MNIIKLILFSLVLFFNISCENSSTEIEAENILNTLWKLEAFETDGKRISPPVEQNYDIKFDIDGTFIGESDCNKIGGNYKIDEVDSLTVLQLGTTFAYCGDDSFYTLYISAIQKSSSFQLENNKFILYYENNSKLIFKHE